MTASATPLPRQDRSAAAQDDDAIGALPCGFAWLDAEGHILGCNAFLARLLGREPAYLVGRPLIEFAAHEDVPSLIAQLVDRPHEAGSASAITFECPDGHPSAALVSANALRDADGHIGSIAVALLPMPSTAPWDAEGAAAARLPARRLADHSSEMLLIVDRSGRISDANRAAWERLGYTRGELLDTAITEIDLGSASAAGPEQGSAESGKGTFRSRLRCRDGGVVPVEVRLDVLAEGGQRRIFVAARDISREVAATAAASHSQREFADLVASFEGIAWAADADTLRFVYVSEQAEPLTGFPADEWLRPGFWAERVHPDDREGAVANCLAAATAGARRRFEYRFLTRDDEPIWIRDTVVMVAEPGRRPRLRGMMVDITEEKRAALRLREAEARFRCLVEDALAGVYMLQRDRFVYANPRLSQIFGYTQGELLSGMSAEDLAHPEDRPLVRTQLRRNLAGEIETLRFGFRGVRKDGGLIELELLGSCTMLDEEPTVVGTLLDVTEQRRAEEQARLAARTLEASAEGIVITDAHGKIVKVNAAFTTITGYSASEIIGRTPAMLKSGRQDAAFYRNLWSELTRSGHWSGEMWNRRRSGEIYPEWLSITAVRSERDEVTHYIGIFSDLTQRKHIEATLDRLAHFDPLTGLPNRTLMLDRLTQSMASARRHDRTIAVLVANLDRLQQVNDSLGHTMGDALLRCVAERMQESVRPDDTVCRYGGDEFVIILSDLASSGDAAIVAEKVLARIAVPVSIEGHELATTASVGISVYPADGEDPGELLKYADIAMHHAKSEGRGTYQFYRAQMNAQSLERLLMEASLRRALERDEFQLHYQPVVRAGSNEIVSLEALIRWRHPEMGMVAPVKFIPLAEETGLIVPIGDWVLREACRCVRAWQAEGYGGLSIAVNLSARQFRKPDLVDSVKGALAESGLDPRSLELELTESMLMHDADRAVAVLSELRALGVRFSIDDFGTGYSSLSYLKRFPIDKLKIDRSFVKDIPGDANDSAIAQAVIALGHSLGLEVVAEGVETPAQLTFLRQHACDAIQGYLFSPPKDRETIGRLLGRPLETPGS